MNQTALSSIRPQMLATALLLLGGQFVPSRADLLYVSEVGGGVANVTSGGSGSTVVTGMNAYGLAFDNAGNLYAANYDANAIDVFTPGGSSSVFAGNGVSRAYGLAFDSAGNLYAANFGNNTIEKFTPGGHGSLFASTGLNEPSGLAFDSAGNLYAANFGNNTIEKFTSGGVGSAFASTGLNAPVGLAFNSAGDLYAANSSSSTIEKFPFSGGVLSSTGSVFASTGLSEPYGLAFDSAGSLYAANVGNNTIEKFNSGGSGSLFYSVPNNDHPIFLAFTNDANVLPPTSAPSAPEPASGALSLLGGLALLAARRPRRGKPSRS